MEKRAEGKNGDLVFKLAVEEVSKEVASRAVDDETLLFCSACNEVVLYRNSMYHLCGKKKEEENPEFYDRFCAVEDPETGEVCKNSLKCKMHSVQSKRAVDKRSLHFDSLLKNVQEEKRKRRREKEEGPEEIKGRKNLKRSAELEEEIIEKISNSVPILEKSFYLPEIKFHTLAIRSMFFQPLKTQKTIQERKEQKRDIG